MIQFNRAITIIHILLYLLMHMMWFSFLRLFKDKASQQEWVTSHVYKWAHKCLTKIRVDCRATNYDKIHNIDWGRNIFLVANHQSYSDIPALLYASRRMFGFIAKYELGRMPFLSFWMKQLGCVFINRERFISAVKNLKKLESLGRPCRLTIFPEGTRSKNGRLGPFRSGALRIAWQLDAILLPAIILGTRRAWEDRPFAFKDYPAAVEFHEPIDLREVRKTKTFKVFLNEFETYFKKIYSDIIR